MYQQKWPMLSPMSERHPILFRAVLSAVVTIAAFAAVEFGLRWGSSSWSELYDGDPYTHWRLKPELSIDAVPHLEQGTHFSVRTSADRLRDGQIPEAEPWVLTVGCSTTFGWGVEAEQAWPEQLERLLGVEVINAGVPGHSTHQGLPFAEPLIARRPDAVILGWGLRDGDLAVGPDSQRVEPPALERLELIKALRRIMGQRSAVKGDAFRVPPNEYARNMKTAASWAQAVGASVLVVDMTNGPAHAEALQTVSLPIIKPRLTAGHRFDSDPVHFTVDGNRAIAEQLAAHISALLTESTGPGSEPRGPQQTP